MCIIQESFVLIGLTKVYFWGQSSVVKCHTQMFWCQWWDFFFFFLKPRSGFYDPLQFGGQFPVITERVETWAAVLCWTIDILLSSQEMVGIFPFDLFNDSMWKLYLSPFKSGRNWNPGADETCVPLHTQLVVGPGSLCKLLAILLLLLIKL